MTWRDRVAGGLRLMWRRRWRVLLVLLAGLILYMARGEVFNFYFINTMKVAFHPGDSQDSLVRWLTRHGFTIDYNDSPWDHAINGGSGYRSNSEFEQRANVKRRLRTGEQLNSSILIICGWISRDVFWVHWDNGEEGKITEVYYGSTLNQVWGGRCPKLFSRSND